MNVKDVRRSQRRPGNVDTERRPTVEAQENSSSKHETLVATVTQMRPIRGQIGREIRREQ